MTSYQLIDLGLVIAAMLGGLLGVGLIMAFTCLRFEFGARSRARRARR